MCFWTVSFIYILKLIFGFFAPEDRSTIMFVCLHMHMHNTHRFQLNFSLVPCYAF